MPNQYTRLAITRLVVEYAKKEKSLAPEIFRLSAEGMPMKDICKFMNKTMEKAEGYHPISDSHVRAILHRNAPFDDEKIYQLVKAEHAKIVKGKFRNTGPRRKTKQQKASRAEIVKSRNAFMQAVNFAKHRLIEAQYEYDMAVEDAVAAGMHRESVIAMAELTNEVAECNGK